MPVTKDGGQKRWGVNMKKLNRSESWLISPSSSTTISTSTSPITFWQKLIRFLKGKSLCCGKRIYWWGDRGFCEKCQKQV